MDAKQLEENFAALLKDLMEVKPKRSGDFIRRCLLMSPPSREKLKVDHNMYLSTKDEEDDDDEEDVEEKSQARA